MITLQARRKPGVPLCGGKFKRAFSALQGVLVLPSTITAQVPQVPSPKQFMLRAAPLCGDKWYCSNKFLRFVPFFTPELLPFVFYLWHLRNLVQLNKQRRILFHDCIA